MPLSSTADDSQTIFKTSTFNTYIYIFDTRSMTHVNLIFFVCYKSTE